MDVDDDEQDMEEGGTIEIARENALRMHALDLASTVLAERAEAATATSDDAPHNDAAIAHKPKGGIQPKPGGQCQGSGLDDEILRICRGKNYCMAFQKGRCKCGDKCGCTHLIAEKLLLIELCELIVFQQISCDITL